MAKNIIMGYNFPNWTPYNLVSYLYQEMLKRNITVEQIGPNQLKIKKQKSQKLLFHLKLNKKIFF